MQRTATTVLAYLAGLPPDRRAAIEGVRRVILANLDPVYAEGMQYGMIGYAVPHSVFPAGYHCDPRQPLPFAALGSQKNYRVIHLLCVYGDEERQRLFREAWAKTGKKLDMGQACIRFKRLEDLALDVLGEAILRAPAKGYIARYLELLSMSKSRRTATKKPSSAPRKPAREKAG